MPQDNFQYVQEYQNFSVHSPNHKKRGSVQNYHVPGTCYSLGNVAVIRKMDKKGRWTDVHGGGKVTDTP